MRFAAPSPWVWSGRARRVAFLLALTTAATLASNARAQGNTQARSDSDWLRAIQNAAHQLNYSGTIYYQQGSEVRISRIVHQFDGSASRERLQILVGERREYLRKGEDVQCLLPDSKRVIEEKRPVGAIFPALSTAAPAEILRNYSLRRGPIDRVADAECQVIELDPKDGVRYGYRLWVERATGLLLRAQMLNEKQEVIEQMAFTDVRLNEPLDPARLRPSWSVDGWKVEKVETRPADINRWSLAVPDGFRPLNAVMRRLPGTIARDAVQAIYSDGLATFSVFIEPEQNGGVVSSATSRGSLNAFVYRAGDMTVTVVGEVPASTVRDVALSVKARSAR
jgi:sigma-E factor negative regulatory protein RseB